MPTKIGSFRRDISETYEKNLFHNWVHGKYVGHAMMRLEGSRSYISPGRMAGYFHDADHQGFVQEDDEERAAGIAHDMLLERGYDMDFINKTKSLIMGTIFKERGSLVIPEQKLIADADLSKLGGDYPGFIKNAVRFFLETKEKGEITDMEIEDFFKNNQPGFFKYLTDISGREETPFLTEQARVMYPHFSKNKDRLAQDIEKKTGSLIKIVRKLELKPQIKEWRKVT